MTLPAAIDARCHLAQAHTDIRSLALFVEMDGQPELADRLVEVADRVRDALDVWTAQAEVPFMGLFRATEGHE